MLELVGALMLSAVLAQPPVPELSLAVPAQPITSTNACYDDCYANMIGQCDEPPSSPGYQQCAYWVVQDCRCMCYNYCP
jgi:hypothetical protein